MNQLTKMFDGQDLTIIEIEGEPKFLLKDLCSILELGQVAGVKRRLDDDVISNHPIKDSLGRTQQTTFINEDGLYDVILDSRKPEAKRFRKWITSEVLPSIRKTGSYDIKTDQLSPELQMFNGLFKALANQELATKQLETKVDSIREVVALNTTDWRKDARNLISKMAQSRGGFTAYKEVNSEIYKEVERRGGFQLGIRLTNKRRRLADEGVSKSKRDKLSKVDVIADDKRLVEIYVAVVKEFAIRKGIDLKDEVS